MKSLVNNTTTYNYLYYATRPQWLLAVFVNISQNLFKNNNNKQNRNSLNKFKDSNSLKNQTNRFLALWTLSQPAPGELGKNPPTKGSNIQNIKIEDQIAARLFQTKELLCWTSDLSFFNLRGYFSNILRALQICRVAARNNRKILFIKGSNSSYVHSMRLNPWLQHQRQILPQTLCSILNTSYLNPAKVVFFNDACINEPLLYQLNILRNTYFKKGLLKHKRKQPINRVGTLHSNKEVHSPSLVSGRTAPINCFTTKKTGAPFQNRNNNKCFYQLNGLLSSYFTKTRQRGETIPITAPFLVADAYELGINTPSFTLSSTPYKATNKHSVIKNQGTQFKETKIRISSLIKLRIKEAQIMSQQTAGTQFSNSLAGFLTNPKTTFNTACSLSNYNYYYSTFSNEVINKKNAFWNPCKVKADTVEKLLPLVIYETANKYINTLQKRSSKSPISTPCSKEDKSKADTHPFLNLDRSPYVKKGWVEHCKQHYYYLSLASSILNTSIHFNKYSAEKAKKQKLVEYGGLGDLFAWQPKSLAITSAFYSSSQNKKTKAAIIKQKKLLETRPPILLGRLSGFFKMNRISIDLKQKITTAQLRFGLMGQFVMLTWALTKANRTLLKRAKKTIQKQGNVLKQAKKNTFTAFLGSSVDSLPKKKAATSLDRRKHCNYITTYKNNYKKGVAITYWYSAPQTILFTFFNKKKIIKKEYPKTGRTPQIRIGKGTRVVGQFQNKVKPRQDIQRLFKNHKLCLTTPSFRKYYKTIVSLNYLKQYEMFVKTPFVNNQLADILFFINPEKTIDVVNQANSLKIPTIGVVSGIAVNFRGRQSSNSSRLREPVNYPILGNPASYFFIRTIIHLFVKTFQTENYKKMKHLRVPSAFGRSNCFNLQLFN